MQNYEKVEQALELLFDSNVSFVLSYRTEGNTCQVARNTDYDDLFRCVTGAMVEFAATCAKQGFNLSDIADEIEFMTTQANKKALEVAEKVEEEYK